MCFSGLVPAHTNSITEPIIFIFVPYYDMPTFTNIPIVSNGHLLQYCATLFGHTPLASVSSVVGDLFESHLKNLQVEYSPEKSSYSYPKVKL